MRVAVYTDYAYHREGDAIFAERAFALFLARVGEEVGSMVLVGRLHPRQGEAHYRIPADVELAALPYYETLSRPLAAARVLGRSALEFWRLLARVDVVWLLGPHPLALPFAALARLRRRGVVLGVRQDLPTYTRRRHPNRRSLQLAADLLDGAWRLLARRLPVVVVGPDLAVRYGRARESLEIAVSLIGEDQIVELERALARPYAEPLRMLSVGRIEREKNPLMLAELLAALAAAGSDWELDVCGEGPMLGELEARLAELGVSDRARLHGYVDFGERLWRFYAEAHVLVHTSWTEGLPQVLVEALAAGTPVVATDVGGIRAALGDAVLAVPPGDVAATAAAVESVVGDRDLRQRLIVAGHRYASAHTLDREARRVAELVHSIGSRRVL